MADKEPRQPTHRASRGGRVYVAMLATTVDDQEPQLLTQEIAHDTVATIQDALAVIRQGVTRACPGQ